MIKSTLKYLAVIPAILTILCCTDSRSNPKADGSESLNLESLTPSEISLYEINVRAFSSSGDIQGVIADLDRIKDIGVNTIWLMPIYPTAETNSVGSPYAISDYKAIHSDFGTVGDLKELVTEAHKRELNVILDWVANHTAWDHKWIKNDGWYSKDSLGAIIHPPTTNWTDVAELNYDNNDMCSAMIDAMQFWITETDIDGFRCDYATGVPNSFWSKAIDSIEAAAGHDLIMFAESDEQRLWDAGFDLIFGWPYYNAVKEVMVDGGAVSKLIEADSIEYYNAKESKHIVRWISNHDDNAWDNTPVHIFGGEQASITAFVISTYTAGASLIYNGQEIGYNKKVHFFEGKTDKIDWSYRSELEDQYKNILKFKSDNSALTDGKLEMFGTDNVFAFSRTDSKQTVLVLANVRDNIEAIDLKEVGEESEWRDMDNIQVDISKEITLDPYEYRVYKRENNN